MNLGRLLRTLRYLKFSQIAHRIFSRPKSFRISYPEHQSRRNMTSPWVAPVRKSATMIGRGKFHILNQNIELDQPQKWNDNKRDKLLLYHLHYMDDLNAADAEQRSDWHADLINQWIDQNPAGTGNGWEPYPLSLRIVNWIKWQLVNSAPSERVLQSLHIQAKVLDRSIEYHLLANHILANAKALCFAGYFFDGKDASRWRRRGQRILREQLHEQILPDGGHFELSPMYHSLILEDVLDLINLFQTYNDDLVRTLIPIANRMLEWLSLMTHPDGRLSYFNDATLGVAPSLKELQAYANRLGISTAPPAPCSSFVLRESGFARYETNNSTVLIDVGEIGPDYQPGHGHCDCLSFELSLGTKRIFVNRGVSTYNNCHQRRQERSTSAHNTVSIVEQEQSEVWSAFRVGRRARPRNLMIGDSFIEAAHDGYLNLGLIHRRRFDFQDHIIKITDFLEEPNAGGRTGTAHFHFHPDVDPTLEGSIVSFSGGKLEFTDADTIETDEYDYCLGFSNRRKAMMINARFRKELQSEITFMDSVQYR